MQYCDISIVTMDFRILALLFTSLWKLSTSVRCYKCSATGDQLQAPCDLFDTKDPRFYEDCPYSTICFKREANLMGLARTATYTERGCAPQTLNGDQVKVNGKWHHVKTIYEAYPESCTAESSDNQRSTKTVNCYCRGDFCNGSARNVIGFKIIAALLLLAFAVS